MYKEFIEENYNVIDNFVLKKVSSLNKEIDYISLSMDFFGYSTRTTVKLMKNVFRDNDFDYNLLKLLHTVSIKLKLNKDLIKTSLSSRIEKRIPLTFSNASKYISQNFVKKLLSYYPEKRVIGLLFEDNFEFLSDTNLMFKRIEEIEDFSGDYSFLPKKPKSLKQVHDNLSRMLGRLRIKNYNLEQREDILALDNRRINDTMIVKVPKTHYDLIDLGEMLKFCIGNGYYSKMVRDKRCSIVGVFDKKGALYGVQFSRYKIMQAYGLGNLENTHPPKEVLSQLKDLLTEAPTVPKDFLPILDSSFIHGYKYNDRDLYLMLSDKIYIYYNVPKDIYEELVVSENKGRYLNEIIKGSYDYDEIK